MAIVTEADLVEALDLGDAKEFFDVFNASVTPGLKSIIEKAWVQLSILILKDNEDVTSLVTQMTAAQWSAFSAGWTLRGLADGNEG